MEKDATATHTDDVPQKKKMFTKQNLITHVKKYWWVHVIVVIVVTLCIALPLVYVGYPNISQGFVNSSEIHVISTSFTNPTNTTVDVMLAANLTVHTIFHASLDGWNATLYNAGTNEALFSLPIPAFKSVTGTPINVSTTAQIINLEAFENFTRTGFQSSSLSVDLVGKGGLKLGALPHITINYNKTITLAGLDGLKSLQTADLTVNATNLNGANNTHGLVIINNQSPLTLELGDTNFDLYVDGQYYIGNATIPNFTLKQGNQSYPLDSTTNPLSVVNIINMPKYQCGIVPVTVVGRDVTFNGSSIPYWVSAFDSSNVTTTVSLVNALDGIGLGTALKPTCQT